MIVRTIDIIMVAALLGSASWTFKVKNDSEQALARVAELENRIEREREAIDILRADWSLLTSPDRLEHLVQRHKDELGLEPARPEQYMNMDAVPYRPAEVAPPDNGPLETARSGNKDGEATGGPDFVTGSIDR